MRGPFTTDPKVIQRTDDPLSKQIFPDRVALDAGHQWIGRVNQPTGETEPVARCSFRQWRQERQHPWQYRFAGEQEFAAMIGKTMSERTAT